MNKDKKPLSFTHPENAAQADGWDLATVFLGTHRKSLGTKISGKHELL
jgi:hypothetical protein